MKLRDEDDERPPRATGARCKRQRLGRRGALLALRARTATTHGMSPALAAHLTHRAHGKSKLGETQLTVAVEALRTTGRGALLSALDAAGNESPLSEAVHVSTNGAERSLRGACIRISTRFRGRSVVHRRTALRDRAAGFQVKGRIGKRHCRAVLPLLAAAPDSRAIVDAVTTTERPLPRASSCGVPGAPTTLSQSSSALPATPGAEPMAARSSAHLLSGKHGG